MSASTDVNYVDVSNDDPTSIQARKECKVLTIPASVTEIADNSFEDSIVEKIIFAKDSNLTIIGKFAFKNCKFLKSISIPPSVVKIAEEAFFDSSLEKIIFPPDSQLEIIGEKAFQKTQLHKSIQIPDSVVTIEKSAFSESKLEEVTFSVNSKLQTIGIEAFCQCDSLQSFTFPQSLLEIGKYAFSYCKLPQSIKLMSTSVKFLGDPFTASGVEEIVILPKENISFQFKHLLMNMPVDQLYSLLQLTLPYILKHKNQFDFDQPLINGEYDDFDSTVTLPVTVLSYLAYAQAFDAFKYLIENVPNTQYTPSHLVACSLFRGFEYAADQTEDDLSNFTKLFDYILQDDIRPHVLGKDKEWVDKSIFTCLRSGNSAMCMKLFSYGIDKDDICIEIASSETQNTLARFSLLSYACKYQSQEVVQYLIDAGVSIDDVILPTKKNKRGNGVYDDDDGDDGDDDDDEGGDDDDDDDDDEQDRRNDETNPQNYYFDFASLTKKAWFEPYFNPYRLNKNQDVEIHHAHRYHNNTDDGDVLKRFVKRMPGGEFSLLHMTPLAVAILLRRANIVRLLLKNGANVNSTTICGFPHLYAYAATGYYRLHEEVKATYEDIPLPISAPVVSAPTIPTTSMEGKAEISTKDKVENKVNDNDDDSIIETETETEIDIGHISKYQKLSEHAHKPCTNPNTNDDGSEHTEHTEHSEHTEHNGDAPSDDDDASIAILHKNAVVIIKELINHGADLFYSKIFYTSHQDIRANILGVCENLLFSIDLFEYLQTFPEIKDKVVKYYIDFFRAELLGASLHKGCVDHLRKSLVTLDYLFQNRYLTLEMLMEDESCPKALKERVKYNPDLKVLLEKHGWSCQ